LFIGVSKKYVKAGFGNGHLSSEKPHWGTWRWAPANGDFERQMKKSSGNRASLYMGALRGEPGGRTHLLGTLKDV
jgi:hypothetical protein